MKYHSISVDQDRYVKFVVSNYLDTSTVNTGKKFHESTLPYGMIFTKDDASTSGEKVEKLTRKFNIHCRDCIGSFIYLLYTIVNFIFAVQMLEKFSSNTGKVHSEGLVHLL